MLLVSFTDQIGLGTVILAFIGLVLAAPTSILAWHTVKREKRAREDQRITRLMAKELGIDVRTGQRPGPPMVTTLASIAEQVQTSNGRTLAKVTEDTHAEMRDLRLEMASVAVALGEHTRDGHGDK